MMRSAAVFFALLSLIACANEAVTIGPGTHTGEITEIREDAGTIVWFELVIEGVSVPIHIDPNRDYGFDLSHLHEHEEQGEPVVVEAEEREGRLFALSIRDA